MDPVDPESLVTVFHALSSKTRLQIIGVLASTSEVTAGHLAKRLGLSDPAAEHHLTRLAQAGLATPRRRGDALWYRIDQQALNRVAYVLGSTKALTALVPTAAPDDKRARVLRAFLDGERLVRIPSTQKKRLVVLEWLVQHFEAGRRYSELELNEILKRHHPDCATLRREMVEHGLMERDRSVYWLTPRPPEASPTDTGYNRSAGSLEEDR